MANLKHDIVRLNACSEAIAWVGKETLKTAWATCPRGDWMLWLAGRVGVDRRALVLAACDCAETVLRYVAADAVLAATWAIDAARRWTVGEADLDEVRAAADATAAAALVAAYAVAVAAAAAANAALVAAANAALVAADDAAFVAVVAAAAAAAAAYAARRKAHAGCARLVRARIPYTVIARAMGTKRAA